MKIVITGTDGGIGQRLVQKLQQHSVVALTRQHLDLSNISAVSRHNLEFTDMLINCAATDIGGKIDFVNHETQCIIDIVNTNLLSPILLTKKVLANNHKCKIVNITSTNNNRYWPNDLVYSLTKQGLANFGDMLQIEYPGISYLEIRLGLTKTTFNNNRYRYNPERFLDIYNHPYLSIDTVVDRIFSVLFDSNIKFIEISP